MEHFPYEERQRVGVVQSREEQTLERPNSGLSVSEGQLPEGREQTL